MPISVERVPLSPADLARVDTMIEQDRTRASVWRFAGWPLPVGAAVALAGWLAVLITRPSSPPAPGSQGAWVMLLLTIVASAGTITLAYGFVRLTLGQLFAGRAGDASRAAQEVLALDRDAGHAERVTVSAECAWPILGLPSRAWLLRTAPNEYVAFLTDDLPPTAATPASAPARCTLTLLPTSRRVLSFTGDGPSVALGGGTIRAADLPEFARGFRALRTDHFNDAVRATVA